MSAGQGMGMGSSMLGGLLQGIAAEEASRSMYNTYKDSLQQQGRYGAQAMQNWTQRLNSAGVDTVRQQTQTGANSSMQDYSVAEKTPLSVTGTGESGRLMGRDQAQTNLLGQARANLGGYGDWLQQQWMANQGTNQRLARIADTAGGANRVLPYQMYDAQHGWDNLAMVGSAFQGMGGQMTNLSQYTQQPQTQQQIQQQYMLPNTVGDMYSTGNAGLASPYIDYSMPSPTAQALGLVAA